jgi:iron-sulfur cluster repair protein YtfE (RIC family)
MKRHETLAPLSRDHHEALILAQLLKKDAPAYKNLPTETNEEAAYAVNFFITHLEKHFLQEENMLQQVKTYNEEIEKLTEEIINEHQYLKTIFLSLDKADNLSVTLDVLGTALENHIRKEERILFPLIQQHCPAEILNTLVL